MNNKNALNTRPDILELAKLLLARETLKSDDDWNEFNKVKNNLNNYVKQVRFYNTIEDSQTHTTNEYTKLLEPVKDFAKQNKGSQTIPPFITTLPIANYSAAEIERSKLPKYI